MQLDRVGLIIAGIVNVVLAVSVVVIVYFYLNSATPSDPETSNVVAAAIGGLVGAIGGFGLGAGVTALLRARQPQQP